MFRDKPPANGDIMHTMLSLSGVSQFLAQIKPDPEI